MPRQIQHYHGQLVLFPEFAEPHTDQVVTAQPPVEPPGKPVEIHDELIADLSDAPPIAVSIRDYRICTLAISATLGDRNKIKGFAQQAQSPDGAVRQSYSEQTIQDITEVQAVRERKNRMIRQEAAWRLVGGDGLLAYNKSLPITEKILPRGDEIAFIYAAGSQFLKKFEEEYGGTGTEFQAARAALVHMQQRGGITADSAIRELWTSPRVTAKHNEELARQKRSAR